MSTLRTASTLTSEYQAGSQVLENDFARNTTGELQHKSLSLGQVTVLESDEESVTTIREYDTGKPIDEVTGKPPLLRETTQARTKKDTGSQQLDVQQADSRQRNTASASERNKETQEHLRGNTRQTDDSVSESTTVHGMTRLQTFFCISGAIALLALCLWGGWMFKKHL